MTAPHSTLAQLEAEFDLDLRRKHLVDRVRGRRPDPFGQACLLLAAAALGGLAPWLASLAQGLLQGLPAGALP